ncbi:MAG: DUF433 domain-containing protein [Acidiferrobacteraceae bacterium]
MRAENYLSGQRVRSLRQRRENAQQAKSAENDYNCHQFMGGDMAAQENIIAAFSEEHAERLTGITRGQLRYWDRTGFYRPSYAEDNRRVAFSRVYSFKDIVALRVLHVLRNQYNVALQHLRVVSSKLSHLEEARWTGTRLWVLNKRVIWQEPATNKPQEVVSQQYVLPTLVLDVVISDTRRDVRELNVRPESKQGQVEQSRFVNHNAAVIAGTRIPVDAIKRFADAGYTTSQIIEEYPDLTEKDVEAALAYKKAG